MSHQLTFADYEFNGKHRQTRKEIPLVRISLIYQSYANTHFQEYLSRDPNKITGDRFKIIYR